MNATFTQGDVLKHIRLNGSTDYIRVGGPNPDGTPSVYAHACTEDGRLIGTKGRYLLATTLATRWQIHHTAAEATR